MFYHMLEEMDTTVSLDILHVHDQREHTCYHKGRRPKSLRCTVHQRNRTVAEQILLIHWLHELGHEPRLAWNSKLWENNILTHMINFHRAWILFYFIITEMCRFTQWHFMNFKNIYKTPVFRTLLESVEFKNLKEYVTWAKHHSHFVQLKLTLGIENTCSRTWSPDPLLTKKFISNIRISIAIITHYRHPRFLWISSIGGFQVIISYTSMFWSWIWTGS